MRSSSGHLLLPKSVCHVEYWGKWWYLDANSPRNIRTVLWIESLVSNEGHFPVQYCSGEEYACICPLWNLYLDVTELVSLQK